MAGVQMGFHNGLAKTPFIAEVDRDLCDYCGECLRSCNVKCIGLAPKARAPKSVKGAEPPKRYAKVDSEVCLVSDRPMIGAPGRYSRAISVQASTGGGASTSRLPLNSWGPTTPMRSISSIQSPKHRI